MNSNVENGQGGSAYEVLSPWADADPAPLRGITQRPAGLAGKRIGLYSNRKRAAGLTLAAFEQQLRKSHPTAETSWYECTVVNTPEMLTEGKAKFEAWLRDVDAVVLSVAD